MEYEPQTYFTEHEQDSVKGFTVLATNDEQGYHIAEKWLAEDEDDEDVWMDYWIPAAQLSNRAENGECEPKANLTDEQFSQVCEMVGWDYHEGATPAEA